MTKLTQEIVRELLDYDPDTGALVWRPRHRRWFKSDGSCRSWNTRFAGKAAGGDDGLGYREVLILGIRYRIHRLVWLYMTGAWPAAEIDHINRVRADNRWSNLRVATHRQNCRNVYMRRNNKSGCTGVFYSKSHGKYHASSWVGGKKVHLGCFVTYEEAVAALIAGNVKYGLRTRRHAPETVQP